GYCRAAGEALRFFGGEQRVAGFSGFFLMGESVVAASCPNHAGILVA
ncbi:MAG: hypothetical protein RL369_1449, partial [Pseudomonadota bacterium]